MSFLLKLSRLIDAINELIGKLAMWLILAAATTILFRSMRMKRRHAAVRALLPTVIPRV